jgi:hypothetical protein
LSKHKRVDAIKRYKLKQFGSDETVDIDVCVAHDKRLRSIIGHQPTGPAPKTSDGFSCPKTGCDRSFGTQRGLTKHMTVMRHGKPKKED